MTWNGGLTFLLIERVADCRQRVVPLLCPPQRIVGRPGEGLRAASDSCIAAHFQVPNDNRDTRNYSSAAENKFPGQRSATRGMY